METLVGPSVEDQAELHLLTTWQQDAGRVRQARVLSILFHVAAIGALMLVPHSLLETPKPAEQFTPLIEPPDLTQKAPNKGPIAKELTVEGLQATRRIQVPNSPPSTSRPAARAFSPPAPAAPPRAIAAPPPPQIQAGVRELQNLPVGPPVQPPPQIQEQEKPKLAFETPTAPQAGAPITIPRPDTSVAGAIRELTESSGHGGVTVGDDTSDEGFGGLGRGANLPPSPGRQASSLELLSDPKGVDFRPYLLQVLQAVRRNWLAVYPESARMGLRGKVGIEFWVARDGSLLKVVIVRNSIPALERAAVAGISASHPFPPLPAQYSGDKLDLTMTFSYNMPRR